MLQCFFFFFSGIKKNLTTGQIYTNHIVPTFDGKKVVKLKIIKFKQTEFLQQTKSNNNNKLEKFEQNK